PSMTPAMASWMRAATPWTSSSSFTPRSSPKKRRGGGVWPRGLASPPREEVQPDRPLDGEHLVDRAGGGLLDRLAEQRDRRGDVAGEGLLGALAGRPQGHPPGHPDGGAGDVERQGPRAAAVGLRGLPRLDEPDGQALPDERAEGGGHLVGGHRAARGDGERLTLAEHVDGGVEGTGRRDLAADELLVGEHGRDRVHVGRVVDRRVEAHG